MIPKGPMLEEDTYSEIIAALRQQVAELREENERLKTNYLSGCACRIDSNTEEILEWCLVHEHYVKQRSETVERALAECRAALTELVACKDLKDQSAYNLLYAQTTGSLEKGLALEVEYRTRQPLAWSAARAAIVKQEERK